MKKVFIFIAFAAAAILATSCAKECGINQTWDSYKQQCVTVSYGNGDPNNNFGGNQNNINPWKNGQLKSYQVVTYKNEATKLGLSLSGTLIYQTSACGPTGQIKVWMTAGEAMSYNFANAQGCTMIVDVDPQAAYPAMTETYTTVPAGTQSFKYLSYHERFGQIGTPCGW